MVVAGVKTQGEAAALPSAGRRIEVGRGMDGGIMVIA